VLIAITGYDHPDAARLIAEVQQEYVERYGGPDDTPVDPAEFAPPLGLFLVGYDGDEPVACGGWRSHGTDAEVKRMYVAKRARRSGYARLILAELERTAREAGHTRMILETGARQPEAVALYERAGYTAVAPFGHYADAALAIHLGKSLPRLRRAGRARRRRGRA
jgi:GNAT superfamily N-acetyltransferase